VKAAGAELWLRPMSWLLGSMNNMVISARC
jgi:hypothetical protein